MRPIAVQYGLMPIVCLVTYSCGHYTNRPTERTDSKFETVPNVDLFPIDRAEAHDQPCGLSNCNNMNKQRLSTALSPMIDHGFDILTRLENEYRDMGGRFYTLRLSALSYAEEHPRRALLLTTKLAFNPDLFPEQNPPRSFIQEMFDEIEHELISAREAPSQDSSVALVRLNNCRRGLCETFREIATIGHCLTWLEEIQRNQECSLTAGDGTREAELDHVLQGRAWARTLPEIRRALENEVLGELNVARTMFNPDRFLESGEIDPSLALQEQFNRHESHTRLLRGEDSLTSRLPQDNPIGAEENGPAGRARDQHLTTIFPTSANLAEFEESGDNEPDYGQLPEDQGSDLIIFPEDQSSNLWSEATTLREEDLADGLLFEETGWPHNFSYTGTSPQDEIFLPEQLDLSASPREIEPVSYGSQETQTIFGRPNQLEVQPGSPWYIDITPESSRMPDYFGQDDALASLAVQAANTDADSQVEETVAGSSGEIVDNRDSSNSAPGGNLDPSLLASDLTAVEYPREPGIDGDEFDQHQLGRFGDPGL